MAELDAVLDRLRRDAAQHQLYPAATEQDVRVTEEALGVELPPSYRRFVRELSNGAYLYGAQGVAPVGDVTHLVPIHRFDRLADPERQRDTVLFAGDSNGNEWCFLTTRRGDAGEYEVAYLDVGSGKLYGEMPSFAAWLEWLVEHPEDEAIRSYYEGRDDVLYDELMLG